MKKLSTNILSSRSIKNIKDHILNSKSRNLNALQILNYEEIFRYGKLFFDKFIDEWRTYILGEDYHSKIFPLYKALKTPIEAFSDNSLDKYNENSVTINEFSKEVPEKVNIRNTSIQNKERASSKRRKILGLTKEASREYA